MQQCNPDVEIRQRPERSILITWAAPENRCRIQDFLTWNNPICPRRGMFPSLLLKCISFITLKLLDHTLIMVPNEANSIIFL